MDGRRPGRLVAAPRPVRTAECPPRRGFGSIGWLALVAGLTFVVVFAFSWASDGSSAAPVPATTVVVQVRPGQTLWDVARQNAPGSRPDQVVDRIMQLNQLSDDAVYPGELLRVPSSVRG